jgi:hypothetical protein
MDKFEYLLKYACKQARKGGLKRSDIKNAVAKEIRLEISDHHQLGGMRMAPGRGRGHLHWWPLIF